LARRFLRATAGKQLRPDDHAAGRVIVSELVANAVRHTEDNGSPIEVEIGLRGEQLRGSVRDQGPGFDPDDLPPSEYGGMGLGLVSQLSSAWGVRPTRPGAEVWFQL
jgi:anti-sigma regulatory factor (Ser/Thr protein kinase)